MDKTQWLGEAAAAGTLLPARPPQAAYEGTFTQRSGASVVPEPASNSQSPTTRLDQIRQAGCHLLFRYGYSGMTMREIAASLNIKAASLYYHFPSKQHILFDLMQATVSELLRGLRAIVDSASDPESQLDAAIRWHVSFHTQKREEAFISHSELRSLEGENLRTILRLRREYERLFDSILKRGRRKGVFQMEQRSVIRNCILTMCTATAGWFSPQGPLSADQVADQISHFVRAALVKGEAVELSNLEADRDRGRIPATHP